MVERVINFIKNLETITHFYEGVDAAEPWMYRYDIFYKSGRLITVKYPINEEEKDAYGLTIEYIDRDLMTRIIHIEHVPGLNQLLVYGKTYVIKEFLKTIGFKWLAKKKTWIKHNVDETMAIDITIKLLKTITEKI